MSWKEHRERSDKELEDSILQYLGLTRNDVEIETSKTWDDHKEAVEAAVSPKPDKDTLEVLNDVVNKVLTQISDGYLAIENGDELLATVKAVELLGYLNADN
jgi:hypothetical protein